MSLADLPDDFEETVGKLSTMVGFLRHLALTTNDHGDDDKETLVCTFWSLKNLAESIHEDLQAIVDRAARGEWPEKPKPKAVA